MMKSTWVPVRLDVSSEPHQRIIDTVLIDSNTELPDPSQLAFSLISDALVQPIVRSGRHFTGRLDSSHIPALWKQGTKQIEDQFRAIRQLQAQGQSTKHPAVADPVVSDARKRDDDPLISSDEPSTKRIKPNDAPNKTSHSLIPIHLRLCFNGIYLHDDFDWDPSLESQFTPLDMARSIGKDLKLPEDAIPLLAIAIVEQIHGLKMADIAEDDAERTTAAWPVPSHTNINHSSIVSRNHLPKPR